MKRPIQSSSRFPNIFRKPSLHYALVVPFVLQIFVAVGLAGWFSVRNGQLAVNDLARKLRDQANDQIAHHLEVQLTLPQKINQINLAAISLGLLNLQDFQTTGHYFWQQMSSFNVGYINYANQQGEFIGVERLNNNTLLINERSRKLTKDQLYVYATNQQGDRTQRIAVKPYNPLVEAWYAEAVKAGKPLWSQIYQWDDKPEVMSISSSYPVYGRQNNLLGVIGVDLILTQISDFLQNLKISSSSQTFILERNGFLVASSSTKLPFHMVNGKAKRLKGIDSPEPLIQETTRYLLNHFHTLNAIKASQHLDFQLAGQRQFVHVTAWHDPLGLDWLIVIVVPESDFMEQIHSNTRTTILLCLLALAVAILFGLMTASWITRPIHQLAVASRAIANGKLDQTVEVHGADELEMLSHSFNRMAVQLKESFDELENRVQERTSELMIAKEAAENANRVKSEFLAHMSHELRTPLNIILGFTQVLSYDTSLASEHQQNLASIKHSGQHLLALINQILEASKTGITDEKSFDFQSKHNVQELEALVDENLVIYLSQMPPDWTAALHQAAIKGSDQKLLQLIEQIPETSALLAQALTIWSDNFHFDKILTLIHQVTP